MRSILAMLFVFIIPTAAFAEGPDNQAVAIALIVEPGISEYVSSLEASVTDCVPQEPVQTPGFRGNFWACSFELSNVVFEEPPAGGWDEMHMLTGSAQSRFVSFVMDGEMVWTQRFAKTNNGIWLAQIMFR